MIEKAPKNFKNQLRPFFFFFNYLLELRARLHLRFFFTKIYDTTVGREKTTFSGTLLKIQHTHPGKDDDTEIVNTT
jgi:hypothetical protein